MGGGEGHYGPPCNFGVSLGGRKKFGNMGYLMCFLKKMSLIFKFRVSMTSLWRHNR